MQHTGNDELLAGAQNFFQVEHRAKAVLSFGKVRFPGLAPVK